MAELERSLNALRIEWPATPDVAGRLDLTRARSRGSNRLLLAASASVLGLAAAFAVPDSRSAILRLFHLGGVTIERVQTLPAAEQRPLAVGLGAPVIDARAARMLGTAFLPAQHGALYEREGFVSTLLAGPVLLSESAQPFAWKKLLGSTAAEQVEIAPGISGFWLHGTPHVVIFGGTSPRLAGEVLLWSRGNITFRLEGRPLKEDDALRIARAIIGTDSG